MKYYVTFDVYGSATVEVCAGSEDEAKEKASKRIHVSLCHQCSRELNVDDIGEITNVEPAV